MHRFFIEQKLQVGEEIHPVKSAEGGAKQFNGVKLPPEAARQIALVLRMKAGEEIALFNGDGFEYLSELTTVSKKEVLAKILSRTENTREPKINVTLFQAVIKKDKMEWVAEKCTEIGATKIVPVIAERSVKMGLNETRLKKILKEAAEQSGRARVPELGQITTFENALKTAMEECEVVYVAHESADRSQIPASADTRKIALFVGPEGGFSDAEIQAALALGAKIISLGSTILRAETAAIAGVYSLIHPVK